MNKEDAIDWLKGYQLHYVKKRFGDNYQSKFTGNESEKFCSVVDAYLETKTDLDEEQKLDIEIEMKNAAFTSTVLHTEYESASNYEILKTIAAKYYELNTGQSPPEHIYLGTIFSGEINAEIITKPDLKASFILFDGELFLACLLLCKIIAQSLPFTEQAPHLFLPIEKNELHARLVEDKKTAERTVMGLYCCVFHKPGNSPQYFSDSQLQEYITAYLVESIELFIFSHEMGHYWHGDLEETSEKPAFRGDMKTEWREEHMADLHGLNQVEKLFRENGQWLTLIGPELFFHFLHLQEQLRPEFAKQDSHPPALQRLSYYRQFLTNFVDEAEQPWLQPFQSTIDLLFEYYEKLLRKTVTNLKAFMASTEYQEIMTKQGDQKI